MPDLVWLNGDFVQRDEARVSAFDAGLQHSVGLFETMLAVRGAVHRLDDHIGRLIRSAQELGLAQSLRHNPLAEAVRRAVEHADLDRARIRLTITGGDLNLLETQRESPTDPTLLIAVQQATAYPPQMFDSGVSVVIANDRVNPLDRFAGHKTLNYWPRLRALQEAAALGAGETIFLQVTNYLASGAVSNLFLVRDGVLLTPSAHSEEEDGAIASPVLPGVARRTIIEFADQRGIGVETRLVTVEEMLDADEIFLTNSMWGVLPVVRVEAKSIADGKPGEITQRLRAAWLDELDALRSDLHD